MPAFSIRKLVLPNNAFGISFSTAFDLIMFLVLEVFVFTRTKARDLLLKVKFELILYAFPGFRLWHQMVVVINRHKWSVSDLK